MSEIAFFRRAFLAKTRGLGFQKTNMVPTRPTVEQSMAEKHYIDMCSPQEFVNASDTGASVFFSGFFKTFITKTVALPLPQKKTYRR
jgi:hypothetical protein